MRRTTSALLLSVLVPGLLLVPVVTPASAEPVPVAPAVVELPVAGVDAEAADEPTGAAPAVRLSDGDRRTVLLTSRTETADYGLVGVTWDRSAEVGVVDAWVRTRTDGTWSAWTSMGGAADEEPDAAEAAGTRDGTTPLWVGTADGVQVRVDVLSGAAPTGLRVSLVDPGESPADAEAADPTLPMATAQAAAGAPAVRTRAQWGADESIRRRSASYASSVRAVVVHHTASSNDYAPADVPSLLRGFYAYHVKSRGWNDIGYNVLVDRFGTAWEGRAGGLARAVIGSHAGGFNTGTSGVSMIGTYDTVAPSAAMRETLAQVVAWKLSSAGVDPRGSVRMTSGGSTRFAAGTAVTLPTVMGHRQVSTTACPGVKGYAALPALRERAAALAGGAAPAAGVLQLVTPSSVKAGGTATLVVRGGRPGDRVEVFFAKRGEDGSTRRRDGVFAANGTYTTTFVVDDDYTVFAVAGGEATPRATTRRSPALAGAPRAVAPVVTLTGPITQLSGKPVLLTATGPAGAPVTVWFRKEGEDRFVQRRAGVFGRDGRYTTSYTPDRPHDWFARTEAAASAEGTTGIGPVPNELDVDAPDEVAVGGTVPVAVQGKPGAAVELWFAHGEGSVFTRRRVGVLGADGMYRTSYVAAGPQTYFAISGTRSSTRVTTRTTAAPTATAPVAPRLQVGLPQTVEAGSAVPVTLTGAAGAEVDLWARSRGAAVWTRLAQGRFGTDGRWTTSYTAVDDADVWASTAGTTSGDLTMLTVPALVGPTSAPLGSQVRLTGRARPGDTVVVESRRRGTQAFVQRTVTADRSGAFTTSYAADDEYEYRPVAASRTGALRRTTVAPTAAGPAAARLGTTVVVSGTARPGATVEVLFRRDGAPSFGVAARQERQLPVYRVGRTLTADATGRWQTSFVLSARHRWYARSDGNATQARATVPAR